MENVSAHHETRPPEQRHFRPPPSLSSSFSNRSATKSIKRGVLAQPSCAAERQSRIEIVVVGYSRKVPVATQIPVLVRLPSVSRHVSVKHICSDLHLRLTALAVSLDCRSHVVEDLEVCVEAVESHRRRYMGHYFGRYKQVQTGSSKFRFPTRHANGCKPNKPFASSANLRSRALHDHVDFITSDKVSDVSYSLSLLVTILTPFSSSGSCRPNPETETFATLSIFPVRLLKVQ